MKSSAAETDQPALEDAPLARAFAHVQGKGQANANDQGSDSEAEGIEEVTETLENAQSEVASQPPSSRPSSPLSLTGSRSEPAEYEMDEDED